MHEEVQVQEVIAQVVAANDVIAVIAHAAVARVGLLLVGDLQEIQELVVAQTAVAQVDQIAISPQLA